MTTVFITSSRDLRGLATNLPPKTFVQAREGSASEDASVAVCVLPGTDLSFAEEIVCISTGTLGWYTKEIKYKTAIFRQINKEKALTHHDALEFSDGQTCS